MCADAGLFVLSAGLYVLMLGHVDSKPGSAMSSSISVIPSWVVSSS